MAFTKLNLKQRVFVCVCVFSLVTHGKPFFISIKFTFCCTVMIWIFSNVFEERYDHNFISGEVFVLMLLK